MVYADKSEYYGEWRAGKKEGEGMFVYPNKDIYSGKWHNGKKHGQGTYVFSATGMKYVGEWCENRFVTGRWTYPNGTYFEGEFQNNKPKGRGKWVLHNGNVVEGDYEQMIVPVENSKLETQLLWSQA